MSRDKFPYIKKKKNRQAPIAKISAERRGKLPTCKMTSSVEQLDHEGLEPMKLGSNL